VVTSVPSIGGVFRAFFLPVSLGFELVVCSLPLLPLVAVPRVRPSDRAHFALVTESLLREERAPIWVANV
jgi:hypothetical protein